MKFSTCNIPLSIFPDPQKADPEGLVAYGGSLEPEVILAAYLQGIFPWFSHEDPILWWSPDPRLILYLDDFKVSKSLKQRIRNGRFRITYDSAFQEVVNCCATSTRKEQDGTWITDSMQKAYLRLHEAGYAHSVEVYQDDKLAGGLYGLTLGKVFCGESMFHRVSDASKIALYFLIQRLKHLNYTFIDAQTPTDHLKSLGAKEISRAGFLSLLPKHISLSVQW